MKTEQATRTMDHQSPPTRSLYGDPLAPGAVAGSYIIDGLAVEGGFAAIYRAHHASTGELAAVKVLRAELSASLRMLERFHQEAEAVSRIGHPNIVRIFEIDEIVPGRPYIAMEWLDGRNLLDELRARGPFTVREAVAILHEIGDALSAAHKRGVIHRDLKAPNIMALPHGDWFTTKLIDFGIAKLTAPDDQHTALTTRTTIGTPHTMAPEQILRHGVDARTDIYALGILLYQLVCGRLPFEAGNLVELEQMHLEATPPRASERAPVPAAVDAVIHRALAKHKDERYPSVDAFLDDLTRAACAGPAHAPAPGRAARELRPGLAVHVTLEVVERGSANDDAALDRIDEAMDDVLERARELMSAVGLFVCLETGDALLGAAPLPPAAGMAIGDRAADFGEAVLRAILARYPRWMSRRIARDAVRVRIVVHAGELELAHTPYGDIITGGPLLDLGQWPRAGQRTGVLATAQALAGMGDTTYMSTLAGRGDLSANIWQVEPRVRARGRSREKARLRP